VVSNLYPPHYHGGYELRCAQVAEATHAAGHTVRVLTSTYGMPQDRRGRTAARTEERHGVPVYRYLNQYILPPQPTGRPWRVRQARRELADARTLLRAMREFRPDVVNWWSMYGLAKVLLPLPQRCGISDVHWIEDSWMIEDYCPEGKSPEAFWSALWEARWAPRPVRPLFRRVARAWERHVEREGISTREVPNRPTHVCFVSEHLRALHRKAGLHFPSSEVLHGGVPVKQFYQPLRTTPSGTDRLRILYVGQLTPDRGLHTVIEALAQLEAGVRSRIALSVAGAGRIEYESRVKQQVDALRLSESVTFSGKVPHADMPRLYAAHDLLVFPSMRDEGLPLTMVEAMLAGCAVVTTGSGGAMEIAAAADLPLFPKDDPMALTRILEFMIAHPEEARAVAARGQKTALEEFSVDRMMERWLTTLDRIRNGSSTTPQIAGPG
jgi:glycosyltransferase involved in cell wall biosynthesis